MILLASALTASALTASALTAFAVTAAALAQAPDEAILEREAAGAAFQVGDLDGARQHYFAALTGQPDTAIEAMSGLLLAERANGRSELLRALVASRPPDGLPDSIVSLVGLSLDRGPEVPGGQAWLAAGCRWCSRARRTAPGCGWWWTRGPR